jgi:uncharacterized protein (TIGR03437 family)
MSGVPGESTCAQSGCHVGTGNPTEGSIEVTFEGGNTYTPGQAKNISVRVTQQSNRFGFQMTARQAGSTGTQAGSFVAGQGMRVICGNDSERQGTSCPSASPLEFVEHNTPSSTGQWSFQWTAPAEAVGDVRFYIAANAANGNGSNTGDRIFTANFTLTAGTSGGTRPAIRSSNGVVNGASFNPGIQSGSWVTIFGTDLGPTTRIWNDQTEIVNGQLPTELDGVKVNIAGKPAAVYFISPTQLNVQAPDDIGTGNVQVEVINRNGTSAAVTAEVRTASPALFLFDPENRKYPAAVHADGTFVGKAGLFPTITTRPAKPGDTILLFGTAFGPTNPPVQSGRVFTGSAPLVTPPVIRIGNVQAQVTFAGLSGAGLYQFNVAIPDVPDGDHPVVAELPGGMRTQDNVFITIQR